MLGIGYRLAPEHPFPGALEDAMTAYHWLLHHPYPSSHILFAGDSAGGGLALSLCLQAKLEKAPLPAACICICPWVDLAMTGKSYETNKGKDFLRPASLAFAAKMYCNGKDPKNPLISPYYGDLRGLPPLLIQTGESELLLDEAVAIAEKAKKSGVDTVLEKWPEMVHTWHLFARELPEGRDAIEEIGKFVKRVSQ